MNNVYEQGSVFNLTTEELVSEAERLGIGTEKALNKLGERAGRRQDCYACCEHALLTMELYED
ncbi:MAG: hypothetical protein ABEJ72_11000 [Candidatus Aenigmatarchaeota archaeon]